MDKKLEFVMSFLETLRFMFDIKGKSKTNMFFYFKDIKTETVLTKWKSTVNKFI